MKSTPKKKVGERGYADGRAAVLAVRDKLQEWVTAGRTLQAFYDQHKLPISYAQFTRHAARFVSKPVPVSPRTSHANHPASAPKRPEAVSAGVTPAAKPATKSAVSGPGGPAPRFTHEPKSRVDDDLI